MESNGISNGKPLPFLRALVVEYDNSTRMALENVLQQCTYEVYTCRHADEALALLRQKKDYYNIVLTGVDMPGNINGFALLRIVSSEIKLPIIMVSSDDRPESIINAVYSGCCDYMVFPVKIESVKTMWQHVVRHELMRRNENNDQQEVVIGLNDVKVDQRDGRLGLLVKRGRENEIDQNQQNLFAKKPRLVWCPELHEKFLLAIEQLGAENAVPKKILERMHVMGVTNLTRENVASHLQKFREVLKNKGQAMSKRCTPLLGHPNSDVSYERKVDQVNYKPISMINSNNNNRVQNLLFQNNPTIGPNSSGCVNGTLVDKVIHDQVQAIGVTNNESTFDNTTWLANQPNMEAQSPKTTWLVNQPDAEEVELGQRSGFVDQFSIPLLEGRDHHDNNDPQMPDLDPNCYVNDLPNNNQNINPQSNEPFGSNALQTSDDHQPQERLTDSDLQVLLQMVSF